MRCSSPAYWSHHCKTHSWSIRVWLSKQNIIKPLSDEYLSWGPLQWYCVYRWDFQNLLILLKQQTLCCYVCFCFYVLVYIIILGKECCLSFPLSQGRIKTLVKLLLLGRFTLSSCPEDHCPQHRKWGDLQHLSQEQEVWRGYFSQCGICSGDYCLEGEYFSLRWRYLPNKLHNADRGFTYSLLYPK